MAIEIKGPWVNKTPSPQQLQQVLEDHKQWLKNYQQQGQQANLSGANLQEANFCEEESSDKIKSLGVNLCYAQLQGVNLLGANLVKANLAGANLHGSNLQRANLSGADLRAAQLPGADLTNAKYDEHTRFPVGFSPADMGMVKIN